MTLTFEAAKALALEELNKIAAAIGEPVELLHDQTKEIDRGWVFFFNSAEFIHTGNTISALAGNGPILVTRDGALHTLPSAISWKEAVKLIPWKS